MPFIQQVPIGEATGILKRQFDAAIKRAGHLWHILHTMSVNPLALRDSMLFYRTIMFGESPLTRAQRELLATVTSSEQRCHY